VRATPYQICAGLDKILGRLLTASLDLGGTMTIEQLQNLHQARPFQPFDIHIADGRVLPVDHPELLAVPPPSRTIGVGCLDGTIEIVDLLLVTSLKPRASSTGRLKRPRSR
jgi:hypothetical protein